MAFIKRLWPKGLTGQIVLVALAGLVAAQRGFLRYDAHHPAP